MLGQEGTAPHRRLRRWWLKDQRELWPEFVAFIERGEADIAGSASFQLASQPFASWKLALLFLSVLIASEDELRHTSDRDHRRQRFV